MQAWKRTYLNVTLGIEIAKHWYDAEQYPWWNQILPHLYLGAIPILDWNHHVQLKELGITHVMTITEFHENLQPNLLVTPVAPQDWSQIGIIHRQIVASDQSSLTLRQIRENVKYLSQILRDPSHKVYIHCKAGKGRSAIMSACYLVYGDKVTSEQAIQHLKMIRHVVSLNGTQMRCIQDYEQELIDLGKEVTMQLTHPMETPTGALRRGSDFEMEIEMQNRNHSLSQSISGSSFWDASDQKSIQNALTSSL